MSANKLYWLKGRKHINGDINNVFIIDEDYCYGCDVKDCLNRCPDRDEMVEIFVCPNCDTPFDDEYSLEDDDGDIKCIECIGR